MTDSLDAVMRADSNSANDFAVSPIADEQSSTPSVDMAAPVSARRRRRTVTAHPSKCRHSVPNVRSDPVEHVDLQCQRNIDEVHWIRQLATQRLCVAQECNVCGKLTRLRCRLCMRALCIECVRGKRACIGPRSEVSNARRTELAG